MEKIDKQEDSYFTQEDMDEMITLMSKNPERTQKAYDILKAHNAIEGPKFEARLRKRIADKKLQQESESKDLGGDVFEELF